ncbi:hypothetical protein P171DRAFT_201134 [Karstenula rhodostoma CBS 690.94]|uniref:Uncharacterized protein n=1 Tax=Karstenula rhodostoma CBS 690.94 TaxID=1392251 RepID=A0A9P4PTF5_9PLEO|nr:hypothetical protein P171DRAFT_201134 [Karstenula rhodostoma CBS 690.94]
MHCLLQLAPGVCATRGIRSTLKEEPAAYSTSFAGFISYRCFALYLRQLSTGRRLNPGHPRRRRGQGIRQELRLPRVQNLRRACSVGCAGSRQGANNPVIMYGLLLHQVKSVKDINESLAIIWNNFLEVNAEVKVPPNGVSLYVDGRDIAVAHLLALENPGAANQRFIFAAALSDSQGCDDAHHYLPGFSRCV